MTHLARTLKIVVLIVAAAVPAIAVDPAVRSFVTNHPGAAAYLPPAAGVFWALYRAWRDVTNPSSSAGTPESGGSSTPAPPPLARQP